MNGRKRCLKNTQPINAIEKGFTSQFTNRVITIPRGRLRTPRMLVKSIFSIIG